MPDRWKMQAPAKKGARVKAEEDGKPLPAMSAPKEIKVSCECIDVIPPVRKWFRVEGLGHHPRFLAGA
jgi:hypothetical protein